MSETVRLLEEAKSHQAALGHNWYAEKDYEMGEVSIRELEDGEERHTGTYVEVATSSQMRDNDDTPEADFIVWARNNLSAIIEALGVSS